MDITSERLKLVNTELLGSVTCKAIGVIVTCQNTPIITLGSRLYTSSKRRVTRYTLRKFIQDLAHPLGLRVQHLRSDNGGEYISSRFRDYCKITGTQQQYTAPHTPQQNCISERDKRTMMDMTRGLLNEAKLPKHPWGELAAPAVFLVNRLHHKAIGYDSRYYRTFGKQADLS